VGEAVFNQVNSFIAQNYFGFDFLQAFGANAVSESIKEMGAGRHGFALFDESSDILANHDLLDQKSDFFLKIIALAEITKEVGLLDLDSFNSRNLLVTWIYSLCLWRI
jgi:hypothetical protein